MSLPVDVTKDRLVRHRAFVQVVEGFCIGIRCLLWERVISPEPNPQPGGPGSFC